VTDVLAVVLCSSQTLEFFPKQKPDGTNEFLGNIYEQLLGDKKDGAQAYYNGKIDAIAQALAATGKYVSCGAQYNVCTVSHTMLHSFLLMCLYVRCCCCCCCSQACQGEDLPRG
jgi:hypothetical protein